MIPYKMIYTINMHTIVYQFWRFVYHHERSVIDHCERISLYTLSFCTEIIFICFYGPVWVTVSGVKNICYGFGLRRTIVCAAFWASSTYKKIIKRKREQRCLCNNEIFFSRFSSLSFSLFLSVSLSLSLSFSLSHSVRYVVFLNLYLRVLSILPYASYHIQEGGRYKGVSYYVAQRGGEYIKPFYSLLL